MIRRALTISKASIGIIARFIFCDQEEASFALPRRHPHDRGVGKVVAEQAVAITIKHQRRKATGCGVQHILRIARRGEVIAVA